MSEDIGPLMVTIWCTTYNHEPYIRQCLEGFVMQKTNFCFEAIVHDDASTDGTAAIIKEYAEKYSEIIKPFYETENQYSKRDGSIGRIMHENTHGKYIAICEGDDYWIDPLKLQKQVDLMENNSKISLCHTGFDYYDENKEQLLSGKEHTKINLNLLKSDEDIRFHILNGNRYRIQTMTALFPTSKYFEVMSERPDNWNVFLVGDTPLWIQLLGKGEIGFLPDNMAVYRKHENSACRPQSMSNRLRFILSSDEMRITLAEYIHLSDEKMRILQKRYRKSLEQYLCYEPLYKYRIQPVFDSKCELLLFHFFVSRLGRLIMRLLLETKRKAFRLF